MGNCLGRGHCERFGEVGYTCVKYKTQKGLQSRRNNITSIPDKTVTHNLLDTSDVKLSLDNRISVNEKLLNLEKNVLSFVRSNEEVESIKESVDKMVENIASWFGETNPLLKFSHKYLVGSMAEDTRIIEPNEFDYILVLQHLSQTNVVRVERCVREINTYLRYGMVKPHPVNHAHIRLIDKGILNMYSTFVKKITCVHHHLDNTYQLHAKD